MEWIIGVERYSHRNDITWCRDKGKMYGKIKKCSKIKTKARKFIGTYQRVMEFNYLLGMSLFNFPLYFPFVSAPSYVVFIRFCANIDRHRWSIPFHFIFSTQFLLYPKHISFLSLQPIRRFSMQTSTMNIIAEINMMKCGYHALSIDPQSNAHWMSTSVIESKPLT